MKLDSLILSNLFNYFNELNIAFCVMNNYEDMPEIIPTDVDIAIDKKTFKKLDLILMDIASKHGVEIVQKIWHGYNKCAYILSPLQIDERFRLQLDFFVDFSARGYPNLIHSEIILNSSVKYKNNFYIPAPEVEVPFIIMRRIIKNDLKRKHLEKLKDLLEQESVNTSKILEDIFGKVKTNLILKLIKSGDINLFHSQIGELKKALKKWSKKNTTISYKYRYFLSQCKRVIHRLSHPVGFSIALLGPDGSGKTTIANLVLERVSGSFHGGRVQYWRPYLLPAMGRLKFWNPTEEPAANPMPHAHPQQNRLKSLLRFFYYLIDYIIGYPVKIYRAKVRKSIIIFDRYYYDYFVDLDRYRFNIPRWLPKIFMRLVPSPDITIYLDAEPEDLLKRKQELSLIELKRQVNEFRKIITQIPNSYTIKTDRPIEDISKEASYLILNKKAEQTKKILKSETC